MNQPRLLIWDIETGYNVVNVFSLFRTHKAIPHYAIKSERYIICGSWRWLGDKKIHSVSLIDFPTAFKKDPTDDYHVVKHLHTILSQADGVVAHYGDNFDLKYFYTRAIYHKLPPIPPLIQYDTYKIARRHFLFNNNRLDYLGQFLGLGRKMKMDERLWQQCWMGVVKAVRKMVAYNKQDVDLLTRVFLRLRPYAPAKLNWNLFTHDTVCPDCGSYDLIRRGTRKTITRLYQRYQCKGCGTWCQSVHAIKSQKAEVK